MKGQEEKKESVLGAIKNIRLKIRKSRKEKERSKKKLRDKFMVGVVLGLHRLFYLVKL